jgi:hypothetical protein
MRADVAFKVENTVIPAHKALLGSRCDVIGACQLCLPPRRLTADLVCRSYDFVQPPCGTASSPKGAHPPPTAELALLAKTTALALDACVAAPCADTGLLVPARSGEPIAVGETQPAVLLAFIEYLYTAHAPIAEVDPGTPWSLVLPILLVDLFVGTLGPALRVFVLPLLPRIDLHLFRDATASLCVSLVIACCTLAHTCLCCSFVLELVPCAVGLLQLSDRFRITRLVSLCELYLTKVVERATASEIAKADFDIIGARHAFVFSFPFATAV